MSALLLLAACLLLGWSVARIGKPPPTLALSLNWWVINVAFPALALHLIPRIEFDAEMGFLVASMWFVFLGGWAFFVVLGRALHWSRARIGALTLVCGLGNTSFIGFPLIEGLRGAAGLEYALIADQAGCFVALAVGGTLVAALYSGHSIAPLTVVRRVLFFPPLIALLLGVVVGFTSGWPSAIDAVFARLGATLVPLALFSVGLQFQLHLDREQWPVIGWALGWKLLLAPAGVWLAGTLLGVEGLVFIVAVLEAAMAPMISAAILASQNNLEPKLANTVLGMGILVSFVTVPVANYLLG